MQSEPITDWKNYLREVCANALLRSSTKIGWVGLTVEIDESLFSRRKYNVGRTLPTQWVFGGICRETRDCFMYAVPDRSAETLLTTIQECILPGTTIISDKWRAYPVCKLWQAPYRDSLSIWNFLPDIYSYLTLPISFFQKFYLTKIFLWEILPYQNFLFRNAKKFTIIKVSVNRLYVNVTLRKLRWRQLAPAVDERRKTKTKQNNGLLQRKKQAIELTHEWIVNFDLNSLLHTVHT